MAIVVKDLRKLDLIILKMEADAVGALQDTSKAVLRSATARVPRDRGKLMRSLHVERLDRLEFAVADGVFYGRFVELGEGPYPPVPFLRPAMEEESKRFVKRLRKVLEP